MSYNAFLHYLFLCSNCPVFYQWEPHCAGSCVLSICPHCLRTFLFLARQHVPSSYYTSLPQPQNPLFPRSPFHTEWYLVTKIRMLGCTIATGVSLFLDPLCRQGYNIDAGVSVYILTATSLCLSACLPAYLPSYLPPTRPPDLCIISTHEGTQMPPIPISHHWVISLFPLSVFVMSLSKQ